MGWIRVRLCFSVRFCAGEARKALSGCDATHMAPCVMGRRHQRNPLAIMPYRLLRRGL